MFPPKPPPGKCVDDGFYRGDGTYDKIGDGLCVDEGKVAISFKKRRELSKKNFECICKEACDSEPGCMGYSTNANDDGQGLACRVYGKAFPTLVDRWLDLGSMKSPMYKGEKIVGADGEKGMVCFRRITKPAIFMQMDNFIPEAPPQISLIARQTSTAELLEWQREQLGRCREQQGAMLSLLQQRGCSKSASTGLKQLARGSATNLMPNESNAIVQIAISGNCRRRFATSPRRHLLPRCHHCHRA